MNFQQCINNFPWNRFGTVYDTNSKELKDKFNSIYGGSADLSDYQYIIDRLEHQQTLYRITPWGLKFYMGLLNEEKPDKTILLQNIQVLFEAANYNVQVDSVLNYKPTKGKLEKYEKIKTKLFDDSFDGVLDADYLKLFKSIDRNFMQISIMDYLSLKKPFLEELIYSKNKDVSERASLLVNSIINPKIYTFK